MQLKEKRIVITGGTSGIGLELVKQLCIENDVVVISRSDFTTDLPPSANPVRSIKANLALRTELESATNIILKDYKHVDVLINNAAIQNVPEFLSKEFSFETIQHEIDLNFTSICQLTYLMLPLLKTAPSAIILNMNSGLALTPKRGSAVYCATKGALNIFSQSLGYQLSETSIKVQQAFLPLVDTKMTSGRGSAKLSADDVANRVIIGMEKSKTFNDIGKVKLLRLLNSIAPPVARRILRNS